ncbi:MAG: glucokinase [Betaproteobacteria bacterium]|nr:MAG: glucokinase [Betaproteobacteria bacterium]
MSFPRLLGDIGGTNARFARQLAPGGPIQDVAVYPGADHPSLQDAMLRYVADHGFEMPRWCAIGIANPVVGDRVQMTNHTWSFSIAGMREALGLERFLVINDFTALALALPALEAQDKHQLGGGQAVAGAPLALLGPGTGLGVSGLLPGPGGRGWVPVVGEGGHVTLAAGSDEEAAVIGALQRRFGHASAERALSGPGLENLYLAVAEVRGAAAQPLSAQAVTQAALDGSDALCRAAVEMFSALLGGVAGNLALTLGALGGVYVGGGIVPRLGRLFDDSAFRARFEAKGRFCGYLEAIPVYVVQAKTSPALLGASRALDEM